jgi:flagellum-specific peptidoglycan hydrolase FlgJ
VNAGGKQRWQQATALVSLSTAGAMTGIAFAHGTLADVTSPAGMPAHLLAFKQPAKPASAGDGALRSAIVSAARYYLRLAQGKTPAEMEALIWQNDSSDGTDHGESCAAFASLTLEAGALATGQQSWVTGGTSYPWPLHAWADVRVDPNPQSLGIISVLQDAEAHDRWHPLGDGYTPQPGDWVLFSGHVEVVTQYSGGVLYTIGGDSMPNLSVNAHQYSDPLGAQGVAGFVNNGELLSARGPATAVPASTTAPQLAATAGQAGQGQAQIPGAIAASGSGIASGLGPGRQSDPAPAVQPVLLGAADIPGAQPGTGSGSAGSASHRYSRSQVAAKLPQATGTAGQQAFIQEIAPGAIAAQRQYGVPAAVTIAQAIDESGWGQSQLAAQDHNLFGIKGSGPAGSVLMPTQEYENGQWVTINAPFRVYNSAAESISDHTLLLATSSSYKQAMADRADPDTFANDLTGVYATDPNYGSSLISLMRLYDLYRYGAGTQAPQAAAPAGAAQDPAAQSGSGQSGSGQGTTGQGGTGQGGGGQSRTGQGGAGDSGGTPVGATQGIAAYGLAPGAFGGGPAGASASAQSRPSLAAAIPGAAGPSGAGAGAAGLSRAGAGAALPRQVPAGSGRARARQAEAGSRRAGALGHSAGQSSGEDTEAGRGTASGSRGGAGLGRHGTAGASRGAAGLARQSTAGAGAPRGSATRGATAGAAQPRMTAGGSGLNTANGRGGQGPARPAAASSGASQPSGAGIAPPRPGTAQLGGARIPGVPSSHPGSAAQTGAEGAVKAGPRSARISTRRYVPQIPHTVTTAFVTTAKTPLLRSAPLYREVASETGVRWQLLAACDWMQCRAQPRVSPVYGEKLGTKNPDGTVYRTKSAALQQCARDLIILASAVYGIELTQPLPLSVRDLAKVFAAFRWGGLLAAHHISALEFPYSVQGLTAHHIKMRWPHVPEAPGPDKPGSRSRMAFGAVPVMLGLEYRAVA